MPMVSIALNPNSICPILIAFLLLLKSAGQAKDLIYHITYDDLKLYLARKDDLIMISDLPFWLKML